MSTARPQDRLTEEERKLDWSRCAICCKPNDCCTLVRDHSHTTGKIRGVLCQSCNSWLAVYERNKTRAKPQGRWQFKAWANAFNKEISTYLQQNTGIEYR